MKIYDISSPSINAEQIERYNKRQKNIKKIVENNHYVKLKCNFFGMDSYYYDKKTTNIYKVCNVGGIDPIFVLDNDPHIFELNDMLINQKKSCCIIV